MDLSTLGVDIAPAAEGEVAADEIETSTETAADETAADGDSADAVPSDDVDPEASADTKVEAKPDGRTIPVKYRELFKNDKDLRSLYFQSQEYKKHFETPAKAAETLEQLSALGGFDGIAATHAEFAEIDRMFESGDKALLDKFLSKPENKEGLAKLSPALFQEFRKLDESGWIHEVSKVMAGCLTEGGIGQDLDKLAILLKDNPDALAVVQKIGSLVGGIGRLAAEPPKPKVDPEREKLNRERAEFEKSKSDLFMQGVNNNIGVHIESSIKNSLEPYIKGRTLDKDSYSLIEVSVGTELSKLMNADSQFTSQKDAVLKSKDKERITKFFTGKINKHLPDATKRVMRAFGTVGTASTVTTPAKGAPVAPGVMKLSAPPSPSEIDYKKSGDMIMDSKAILKNGKTVTW